MAAPYDMVSHSAYLYERVAIIPYFMSSHS